MIKNLFSILSALCVISLFGQSDSYNNAIKKVVQAYDSTSIVFFGESHDKVELLEFYTALIQNEFFQRKVDVIALELGNAFYQDILNRYIAGEEVDYSEVRKVWFDATNSLLQFGDSSLTEQLINRIRAINLTIESNNKYQVVAMDPPINWSHIHSSADFWPWLGRRDLHFIQSIWYQLIDKKRSGFVIMGKRHLVKNDPKPLNYVSVADVIEKRTGKPVTIIRVEEDRKINAGIYSVHETQLSEKPIIKNTKITYRDAVDAIIYFPELTPLLIHPFTDEKDLGILSDRSIIIHGEQFTFNSYDQLSYLITTKGEDGIHEFFEKVKRKESNISFNIQLVQIFTRQLKNEKWKTIIQEYLASGDF